MAESTQTPPQAPQASPAQTPPTTPPATPPPGNRRRALLIVAVIGLILAVGGYFYYQYAQTYESTDDAQVDCHLVGVASRIQGTVTAVHVDENQFVKAGEVVVEQKLATTKRDQASVQQNSAQPSSSEDRSPFSLGQPAVDRVGT